MKRRKRISLIMAMLMFCNLIPANIQTDIANAAGTEIADDEMEDVLAIRAYLLGLLPGEESFDINGDGCINAVDLTLAKRRAMGFSPPELKPLRSDTWDIHLNEEANVTFTVQAVGVTDPVILYDEEDNVLAEMKDDGADGDETARDGVYTACTVLSSDTAGNAGYYAAAGELRSVPFEICFYRDLEAADYTAFYDLLDQISVLSFEEAAEFVAQSDQIASYSVNEKAWQISFRCIRGFHCIYGDPEETDEPSFGSGSLAVPEDIGRDYNIASNAVASAEIKAAHPDKKDVIVLRASFSTDHPFDDVRIMGNIAAQATGGTMTCLNDEDVTLDVMKNLGSYGTVLISTHGRFDPDYGTDVLIQTGEVWGRDKFSDTSNPYSADIQSGRIGYVINRPKGLIGPTEYGFRLFVGKGFFDKYYKPGDLDESFWYLGICYGLHTETDFGFFDRSAVEYLPDVLIKKGADAVVGYTDKVYKNYCFDTMFETLINSMILSADNVQKGVSEAVRIYGKTDPDNLDEKCRLQFRGDPHFKLVESIGDEVGSSNRYRFNGHEYEIIKTVVKWSVAKAYCEMHGGHLATVNSEEEERFIEKIIGFNHKIDFYWLGGTDENTEGTWEWVTGEEFSYQNWGGGNPNNFLHTGYGRENYLGIVGKTTFIFADRFEWNDFADATYDGIADYKPAFICEWE